MGIFNPLYVPILSFSFLAFSTVLNIEDFWKVRRQVILKLKLRLLMWFNKRTIDSIANRIARVTLSRKIIHRQRLSTIYFNVYNLRIKPDLWISFVARV